MQYILGYILGCILGYVLGYILGYIPAYILGYILRYILGHIPTHIPAYILGYTWKVESGTNAIGFVSCFRAEITNYSSISLNKISFYIQINTISVGAIS